MARKNVHSPIFRGLSVVLSILFMWGFGLSLLLVFMNISIGFADNDEDFRQAFLEQTFRKESADLESYIGAYLQKDHDDSDQYLISMQKQYAPDNTNFRFAVMDPEGNLLMSNDPDYSDKTPMMVSNISHLPVLLDSQQYPV